MDIKIETAGGWPVTSEKRARKTTLGEGFTTIKAYARVIVSGPDADALLRRCSLGSRLESNKGISYLPDAMKQWLGLGAEVSITSGGRFRVNGVDCFDFGFVMTKRGRGHANYGKQFRGLLTELDKAGTLQEVGKQIVEDELNRIERMASEETLTSRIGAVAAYIYDELRQKANVATDFQTRIDAARSDRDKKVKELCTMDLLEQVALDNHLPLDRLIEKIQARIAAPGAAFIIGG
jgi:hypothetical protein